MRDKRTYRGVVLGGYGPETSHAILIKVKNSGELARTQGTAGALASVLAPGFTESQVYGAIRDKLAASLKDSNVDADVSIVDPKNFVAADGHHIATDIGLGILAAGGVGLAGVLLWRLFGGKRRKR